MNIEIIKCNDNPVAGFFSSPSNTPETDDQPIIYAMNDNGYQVPCVDLEFARRLKRERDEAKQIISSELAVLPVGYIPAHTAESIPNRIADLCNEIAKLERERDEAREQAQRLRALAERLSIYADNLEKYIWHCNDQGCDCWRCKLAIEQKELRAELNQLKEGAK
jgi:hypothetical protein